MDPAEVRRRNYVPRFTEPYTTGIGTVYDVGDYPESLDRALEAAGYDELRAEQARRRAGRRPGRARHRHRHLRRDHRRRRSRRARRRSRSATTAGARAQRGDAVRPGPRHDVGDDRRRRDRRADRADRGRPRRHRLGPVGRAHRRVAVGAARRGGDRQADVELVARPASGPPSCSRRTSTTSCSTPTAGRFHVAGTPARSIDWADLADRRRPLVGEHSTSRRDADVPVRHPRGRRRGRHRDRARSGSSATSPSTTPARCSTRCSPRARCTAASPRASPRRCSRSVHYDDDGQPLTTNFADYPVISAAELPSFELVADGDADVRQPARRQGRRRVGHDRVDPGGVQRRHRRPRSPRGPPPGDPAHAGADLAGAHPGVSAP